MIASKILLSVSQDEHERAINRSRRMYQSDQDSNRATLIDKGKVDRNKEIAKIMIASGEPFEKIVKYTGITNAEVESLLKQP